MMHIHAMDPRKLLNELMARAKPALNPYTLARRLNNQPSQPQIHKFLAGVVKEPRRSTIDPIASFFGIPTDALRDPEVADVWYSRLFGDAHHSDGQDVSDTSSQHPQLKGQSGLFRLDEFTVPPMTEWEDLMQYEILPSLIRISSPDMAIQDDAPMGSEVIMSTSNKTPAFGDIILVKDRAGKMYLRLYAEGKNGAWKAIATTRNVYIDLDSAEDKISLVAVAEWVRPRKR